MPRGKSEPLTVYVCPVCATVDLDEHYTGGHDFDQFPDCHRNRRVPVQYVAVPTLLEVLSNGYHPQNPTAMHPTDYVTLRFELDGHEGLRDVASL